MVDLKRLDNAFQNLLDGTQKLYFWSEKMDESSFPLVIDLREKGLVSAPFSPLGIEKISEHFEASLERTRAMRSLSNQAAVIDKENFGLKLKGNMSFKKTLNGFASLFLAKSFGVSLENLSTSVQVKPDCLVICHPGEVYQRSYNFEKVPGTFGCMFLQLPVDGEDRGCHLRVQNRKELLTFDFKEDSSTSLYLGVVAGSRSPSGKQEYTLQTAGNGAAVMIVCNLVWMDSFALTGAMTPDQFPEFISSVHEVNQSLSSWRLPTVEPSKRKADKRMLCLPLQFNYSRCECSFSNLKGVDRQMAHILKSIDYLDVDLAVLEEERIDSELEDTSFDGIERMYHWKEKTISEGKVRLHKLNTSDESFVPCCLTIDAPTQIVGSPTSSITDFDSCFNHQTKENHQKASDMYNYRPVIVIQPKYRRFAAILKNPRDTKIFKYFESKMAGVLQQVAYGNEGPRSVILSDLGQAIPYLKAAVADRAEPSWEANYVLFRLLSVCCRLKSTDEGLALLDIITKQHLVCKEEEHVYSEVYLPQFTDSLADFICLVSGWAKTSELILRLAATSDFSRSYAVLCDLGIKLYDRDCLEGAVEIADTILTVIYGLPDDVFQLVQDSFSWDLVDLLMYIDNDHRSPVDPARYAKLVGILQRLPCDRLPYLLPHVEYSPKLVLDLGRIIVNSSFTTLEPHEFLEVIKVCENLHANELLYEFWARTCAQSVEFKEENGALRGVSLFEALVLNDSLKMAEKGFLVRSMSCLPDARERFNVSVAHFLRRDEWKSDVSSISFYFLFIALAQALAELSDEERIRHFSNIYELLPTDGLCSLVSNLRQLDCTTLKQQTPSHGMFKSLLEQVLKRDFKALVKSANDSFLELFRFFSWFGDTQLIVDFFHKLLDMEDDFTEKWKGIVSFVIKAVSDPDIVWRVDDAPNVRCSTLSILLEALITACVNLKDHSAAGHDYLGLMSAKCFETYVKAERLQLNQFDAPIAERLGHLLNHLHPLSQVLVINDVFNREINVGESNMKTLAVSWKMFVELSKSLVSNSLLKSVFFTLHSNQILHLVQSFLWLGEEQPIVEVTTMICKLPVVGSPLSLVSKAIVSASKTLSLAATSTFGVIAVNDFIDHCIERYHFKSRPKQYSWALADIVYTKYPEIEHFLRSETRKFRYGSFQNAIEAERFVSRLNLDPAWGVTVKVKLFKNTFRCEFFKTFGCAPAAGELEKATMERVDELKAIRRRLLTSVMRT